MSAELIVWTLNNRKSDPTPIPAVSQFTSRIPDPISTMRALFAQNNRRDIHAFQADHEYLTNQRRRNLPVGEGRQSPSGEPATGLAEHSGNWVLMDGTRKLLQRM
jgi:hypothetical protein